MEKFFAAVLIKVITDPKVQQTIKDLLGTLITERILPLVPVAIGAAVAAAIEKVPGAQGLVDLVETTDAARHRLDELIPDIDFGIPALDEIADFWRPKNG